MHNLLVIRKIANTREPIWYNNTTKFFPYLYNYNQVETLKFSIIVTGIYQFYEVV